MMPLKKGNQSRINDAGERTQSTLEGGQGSNYGSFEGRRKARALMTASKEVIARRGAAKYVVLPIEVWSCQLVSVCVELELSFWGNEFND